jgi:predicted nucleic acid-binding protein
MNGGKVFLDTNVILYMYAEEDKGKQAKAKELFQRYATSSRMLLSTQVVQEFYAVGSRKLRMPRPKMMEIVASLLGSPLVVLGPAEIVSAIQIEERYNISFWDALILAAAESGGAEVVYTEDLNDGQQYGSVTVRNPFRASTI